MECYSRLLKAAGQDAEHSRTLLGRHQLVKLKGKGKTQWQKEWEWPWDREAGGVLRGDLTLLGKEHALGRP